MKKQSQSPERVPRRNFFLKGVLAGAAVLFGLGSARASSGDEEMVKLITAEGKLVEVPKSMLPKPSGERVSNKKLLEWKENHDSESFIP